jgi:hypothetical protein
MFLQPADAPRLDSAVTGDEVRAFRQVQRIHDAQGKRGRTENADLRSHQAGSVFRIRRYRLQVADLCSLRLNNERGLRRILLRHAFDENRRRADDDYERQDKNPEVTSQDRKHAAERNRDRLHPVRGIGATPHKVNGP